MLEWLRKLFGLSKKEEPVQGEKIGTVTHYFPKPKVAVVKIEKGKLSVGDTVNFRGHTTNFKQRVDSIQVDHKPIQEAGRGREIGLQVKARVRPHDSVYKL